MTTSALALTEAQYRHGTAAYQQRNEKQSIYLDTMRGSLSGSFTLTFTDAFGQPWTTDPIAVNARLSSKAYVYSSKDTTTKLSGSAAILLSKPHLISAGYTDHANAGAG